MAAVAFVSYLCDNEETIDGRKSSGKNHSAETSVDAVGVAYYTVTET
jgi:hypothetical protein